MSAQVLFEKIANGQSLTALEKTEMVMIGRGLDESSATIKSWTIPNTQNAKIKNPVIENPLWRTSPLHSFYVNRTTNISVVNSTDTVLTWENTYGETNVFELNAADKTKVMVKVANVPFNVCGIFSFAVNATGYRNIKLSAYDVNDTLIATVVLAGVAAPSGTDLVQPFAYPITAAQKFAVSYFKVTVAQGSGGNLNFQFCDFGMFLG